jgi:Domain of unknown function (DUF397)
MNENLTWIKSTYSTSQGSECVEVASLADGGRLLRDSKDPDGPVLRFTADEWRAFVRGLKAANTGH